MGDRGNIFVKNSKYEPSTGIYFYTHWSGSDLKRILANALKRGEHRWDDEPYLNRIIFCEMIQDDVLGECGFGISNYETDNEHPILKVDPGNQTVTIDSESLPFKDFVKKYAK